MPNGDNFRHWETRFDDYCLLEGYRDPTKDRTTQTNGHYIAAKWPFEVAILWSLDSNTKLKMENA
jgi:hypothetical protein